jgi:outer membrane protein TolC
MRAQPGGLTAEQVAARSADTSFSVKAAQENLRGAAARVDEAWTQFLPRLSALGRYTRLSNFTPPSFGTLIGLNPNWPAGQWINSFGAQTNPTLVAIPLSIPIVVDNWLLQGTINVPISDYFLRIDQGYSAATHSQDAARWDLAASRATASANGKVAYYTWLRARGAHAVAVQSLNDQLTHLRDARNQFAAGNASKADVLRAETAVASAGLALERANNLADLSEKQLRVAIHVGDEVSVAPAEDLETGLPPVPGDVKQLTAEALTDRAEVKSADLNAAAARKQAEAAKAARYPAVSAFGDAILGNPNPRIFPPSQTWFPTWDLGAQVTWSPNDLLLAGGNIADAESRVAAIEANKNVVRDGIEVEVTQSWQAVKEADFGIESSLRELASATEAYRVQRELFNNGRGTSTTLTDAETELTRARLDLLNARADARIARTRLDHALGRDLAAVAP